MNVNCLSYIQVSAFSTWDKELHKIVFDPRYLLLNPKERKQVYLFFFLVLLLLSLVININIFSVVPHMCCLHCLCADVFSGVRSVCEDTG